MVGRDAHSRVRAERIATFLDKFVETTAGGNADETGEVVYRT